MKKFTILIIMLISISIFASDLYDEGSLMAVLYHQTAAEYRAICYQAYNLAADRLTERLKEEHKKPPAIIVDVDETVLSNSEYNAREILNKTEYPTEFYKWLEEMSCAPIAGAVEFLNMADSAGVKIFYITNRRDHKQQATIGNLKKHGFPQATPEQVLCKTKESSKEPRRSFVAQQHDILLLIGDNLLDFAEYFTSETIEERYQAVDKWQQKFGRDFIILPNIMHGYWEKLINDFQWDLSPEQLKEKRLKHLRN